MTGSFIYLKYSGHTLSSDVPFEQIIPPLEQTVVQDPALLESVNPSFYTGVQVGDLVLRYQDRIDLYRPSESRLIRRVMLDQ